jgi:hypothetical protein
MAQRGVEEVVSGPVTEVDGSHGRSGSMAHRAHAAIERSLHARRAMPGTRTATLEDRVKRAGRQTWELMKRHPSVGVVVAGGAAFGAATLLGAAELAAGAGAAYAAYQILKKGKPLRESIEEARKIV